MAASLAVEWAKDGVRVNALRSIVSLRCLPLLAADDISLNSPGYMLTKLTRDILARDDELKVVSSQLFVSS